MTAYLIEHPPRQRQFRERGTTPSGVIVLHTAENAPDLDGADGSAEAVARFIQGRSDFGSYHLLADRDSIVHLVPFGLQAYGDGTGSNPHAIHVSGATQAAAWGRMTRRQKRALAANMAKAAYRAAKWLEVTHGVEVPARRITRAQSDARVPGFITHAERDPERRSDPGAGFPWDYFLARYAALSSPKGTPNWDRMYEAATDALRTVKRPKVKDAARRVQTIARRYSARY